MNEFHRGAYLVYLNGIEVPCPSVNVDYGVWEIPQATLSFAPHRLLERLGAEDRLDVVVFYLDDLYEPENPRFRLLFEGEILGWSYQNSPFGRQMVFNAIADISVFTQLFFFFINTVEAAVQYHTGTPQGAGPAPANIFYPTSLFYKGLITNDKSASSIVSTPFEVLYNVVKGMISSQVDPDKRTLPSVNFYSRWIRKRNFHNRFVALPLFEDPGDDTKGIFPVFKAVQCDVAADAMREQLAPTVGENGTLWDNLKTMLDKAYTEIAMIPTAPALRARLSDGVITDRNDPASTIDPTNPLRLGNYFCKPQMLYGIAPTCNVFFPPMVRNLNYNENYWQQPSRVYVNDSFVPKVLHENAFTAAALRVGYPPEVNAAVQQAVAAEAGKDPNTLAARALYNAKNLLVFPEEFFRGPVLSRSSVPSWFTLLMKQSQARRAPAAVDEQRQAVQDAATKVELNSIQALFQLYAEYEYYRQRYEKRAGAVDLVWNPYVVPGFPCVTFDSRAGALDMVGYVTHVHHSLATPKGGGQMTTSVSFGYGRTLWEMIEGVHHDSVSLGQVLGSSPPDPVEPVRNISQDFEQAERLYRRLFFGSDANLPGKSASFDFRNVIGFAKSATEVGQFQLTGPALTAAKGTVTSNLLDARQSPFVPLTGFTDIFKNFDEAMRYVSRPVCTLEEYIQFIHQNTSLQVLRGRGDVADPQYFFCKTPPAGPNPPQEPPAVYYSRIRKLQFSAANLVAPGPAATGTDADGNPVAGNLNAVPLDFPQTRDDWDSRLLQYREEMYTALRPQN